MNSKEEALAEILDISRRNNITLDEISDAFPSVIEEKSGVATKLFSYLGGIFVFSGIAAYVGIFWEEMSSAPRIIITLGSGIVLYILALISSGDKRYEKTVTPLFIISSLLQPTGLFVTIEEFSTGGDWHIASILVFGVMLVQQFFTFLLKRRATLLFMSIFFGSLLFWTIFDLIEVSTSLTNMSIGLSLLCITYGITKTQYHSITAITGFWYFVASFTFLLNLFDWLRDTPIELLFLCASCFMIYVSTITKSRVLLFVSTISLLFYIAYYTKEHFINSVGWPMALILLGFLFFGISMTVLKINRRMKIGSKK